MQWWVTETHKLGIRAGPPFWRAVWQRTAGPALGLLGIQPKGDLTQVCGVPHRPLTAVFSPAGRRGGRGWIDPPVDSESIPCFVSICGLIRRHKITCSGEGRGKEQSTHVVGAWGQGSQRRPGFEARVQGAWRCPQESRDTRPSVTMWV